jgi:hypothetical protein
LVSVTVFVGVAVEVPVKVGVLVPEAVAVGVAASGTSSAPISGAVGWRVSPSKSTVMPAIGVARPRTGLVACRCKFVAETNWGFTDTELKSCPTAICHADRSTTSRPLYIPNTPPVPLTQ